MNARIQQHPRPIRRVGREAERSAARGLFAVVLSRALSRASFTLVELLIVIAIITVLASLTLASLFSVQEDAKEARTMSQVARLDAIVMERWNSYQTMTMRLNIPSNNPNIVARERLNAIREQQRMELPDRMTDVIFPRVSRAPTPSVWRGYRRRVAAAFNSTPGGDGGWGFAGIDDDGDGLIDNPSEVGWVDLSGASPNFSDDVIGWTKENEGAECLYMIVASARDGDKSGLDFFRPAELGDIDGDGMPEILDPWGIPIRFLRWAPGFISPLQEPIYFPNIDPDHHHDDLFDPLKLDPRYLNNDPSAPPTLIDDPFQLFPLIFAAGRDHESGIIQDDFGPGSAVLTYALTSTSLYSSITAPMFPPPPPAFPAWPSQTPWASGASAPLWTARPRNDPYVILPGSGRFIGWRSTATTSHVDNIHNHLLEVQ